MAQSKTWIDVAKLQETLTKRKTLLGIVSVDRVNPQCIDCTHKDGSKKRWFNPGERKVLFTPEPEFVV